jgi:predicted ATP-grasp superfamily ATP-dependent carboligase
MTMPTSDPLPGIVLGGKETAVPVCRSLGRAGIPVIAVGEARDPIADSRYCTQFIEVDSSAGLERQWLAALTSNPAPGVFLPVSDHGVELVVRNRHRLEALGYVCFETDASATLGMLDKGRSYELAAQVGVPTPKSLVLREPEDLEIPFDGFDFPFGLKPLEGHLFREHTGSFEKLIVVGDREELLSRAAPLLEAGIGLMATEIVPGGDDNLYGLYTYMGENGESFGDFTGRKLRQDPPHFGVGCYVRQEDQAEVAELGLRLLREIGYRGFAHVEFKRDPRSGVFKFIECNARFSLQIGLLTASGLDFPLFAYRRALGIQAPPPAGYRRGLHLWHPVPDLRSARQLHDEGELTWWGWLKSLLRRQCFTLLARDDPRPSLVANARTVRSAVSKRLPRGGGRTA